MTGTSLPPGYTLERDRLTPGWVLLCPDSARIGNLDNEGDAIRFAHHRETGPAAIAAFILARVAEWEDGARAAASSYYDGDRFSAWVPGVDVPGGEGADLDLDAVYAPREAGWIRDLGADPGAWPVMICVAATGRPDYVSRHIARHDPSTILALCAALRGIVALHTEGGWRCDGWDAAEAALCHLAAIWRRHLDWREEWTP